MPRLLVAIAILFAFLSLLFLILGIVALRRKRIFHSAAGFTFFLLMFLAAALCATITVSTQGYRALTREETAVVVSTERVSPVCFNARFRFSDGQEKLFHLAGDELYVDAHILKWKPIANFFGIHTGYELDRVAGRYARIEDERSQPRTVFSLAWPKWVDMFDLRRSFSPLRFLVDAEYGSATFISAKKDAQFEVRVSTTGLLVRKIEALRKEEEGLRESHGDSSEHAGIAGRILRWLGERWP